MTDADDSTGKIKNEQGEKRCLTGSGSIASYKTIDESSVLSLHDNYTQENTPTET